MTLSQNNKTLSDYSIDDKYEAGLELFGHEVKSLKAGGGDMRSSRVIVRGGEAFVVGLKIRAYQPKNLAKSYEEDRIIKLLLNKKELIKLYKISEDKKINLIPSHIYTHNNLIKMTVVSCTKLNKHDKREKIKERDLKLSNS